jgi:hypothetical protein
MSMEAAVQRLERANKEAGESLDEIERKILLANPAAKPLLDLCARLRSAKARFLTLRVNTAQLFTIQDQLKQNLAQYLIPTAESIKLACTARSLPTPRVVFSSPGTEMTPPKVSVQFPAPEPIPAPVPALVEPKVRTPVAPKQTRHVSPRPPKQPLPPPPFCDFVDITDEEFASLDTRTMGHITIGEVRDVYKFIWTFFKDADDKKGILTRKLISESGARMRALPTALKFLKSLHRIDLTKQGDVKWP